MRGSDEGCSACQCRNRRAKSRHDSPRSARHPDSGGGRPGTGFDRRRVPPPAGGHPPVRRPPAPPPGRHRRSRRLPGRQAPRHRQLRKRCRLGPPGPPRPGRPSPNGRPRSTAWPPAAGQLLSCRTPGPCSSPSSRTPCTLARRTSWPRCGTWRPGRRRSACPARTPTAPAGRRPTGRSWSSWPTTSSGPSPGSTTPRTASCSAPSRSPSAINPRASARAATRSSPSGGGGSAGAWRTSGPARWSPSSAPGGRGGPRPGRPAASPGWTWGPVHVYDLGAEKPYRFSFDHPVKDRPGPMAVSADGKTLYLTADYGRLFRWDLANNKKGPDFVQTPNYWTVTAIALSPDESTVFVASDDHLVRRWDTKTGKELPLAEGYAKQLAQAVAADGKHLVLADYEERIDLWDLATGKRVRQLGTPYQSGVICLATSADGKWLAAGRRSQDVLPHRPDHRQGGAGHASGGQLGREVARPGAASGVQRGRHGHVRLVRADRADDLGGADGQETVDRQGRRVAVRRGPDRPVAGDRGQARSASQVDARGRPDRDAHRGRDPDPAGRLLAVPERPGLAAGRVAVRRRPLGRDRAAVGSGQSQGGPPAGDEGRDGPLPGRVGRRPVARRRRGRTGRCRCSSWRAGAGCWTWAATTRR